MTSYLVLIFVILFEVVFCGGVSRFSFAFYRGRIPLVAMLMPLTAISSFFLMCQLINGVKGSKYGDLSFLFARLFIWVSIVFVFFSEPSFEKGWRALVINNSWAVFCVTMTIVAGVNTPTGFLIRRQTTNFILYNWIDQLLQATSTALVKRIDADPFEKDLHGESIKALTNSNEEEETAAKAAIAPRVSAVPPGY